MSDDNQIVEEQAAQQTGNRKIRLRVDQRDMETTYANSFRPVTSTEELMLDFGINQTFPLTSEEGGPDAEIVFNASSRVILNYYTAKRLAMALGQIIGKYESEFGEVELNAANRKQKGNKKDDTKDKKKSE
jgi:hypothetical protein